MTSIFISYRRDDAGDIAGRMYDALIRQPQKPNVFLDVEGIGHGENYLDRIKAMLAKCDVIVVVIGPKWTGVGPSGSRILLDSDVVRMEVAQALISNRKVLPVMVSGARTPLADELPVDLVALRELNHIELRQRYFNRDIDLLFDSIWGVKRKRAGQSLGARIAQKLVRALVGGTGAAALMFALVATFNAVTGNSLEVLFGRQSEFMVVVLIGLVVLGALAAVFWPRKRVLR